MSPAMKWCLRDLRRNGPMSDGAPTLAALKRRGYVTLIDANHAVLTDAGRELIESIHSFDTTYEEVCRRYYAVREMLRGPCPFPTRTTRY